MQQPRYRGVSLPAGLLKQVEDLLEETKREGIDSGYKTMAEFVKDAVRRRAGRMKHSAFCSRLTMKAYSQAFWSGIPMPC